MTTYKEILGTSVQNFAGDPGDPITGQVWYDSVSSSFKYRAEYASGAWATGGAMNTARQQLAGAGAQTAALAFGGNTANPPTTTVTGITESYNGTSWTELNDLNIARNVLAGCGTNTAALAFGGAPPITAATEEWNAPGSETLTITTTV